MPEDISRRSVLRSGAAMGALAALGWPDWLLPALAQGETLVPFTDMAANFATNPSELVRVLDIRRIESAVTSKDQFFTLQHYGQPDVDPTVWRLSVDGLVDKPFSLHLDELRKIGTTEIAAGFECSGNGPGRMNGLASNGRWTGVPLRTVLSRAGLEPDADEVVFFGADRSEEDVDFRGRVIKVTQQFGRSLSVADATRPEPFLAHALNGEPLTKMQGFPLRLIVPGWYGVANVKWLSEIHVQRGRYLGKFQARWYRTLRGESISGEMKYTEAEVGRQQLKSVVARVTRADGAHRVHGFVLNDGTALKSVEVRIDDGPWRPATMDASNSKFSWKLFSCPWADATPGEHTIVSRVTDVNGRVQPTATELESKLTALENNAQWPRKVQIG